LRGSRKLGAALQAISKLEGLFLFINIKNDPLVAVGRAVLKKGYIQVYTGDCKGKTTAAIGLAMRAIDK